METKQTGWTIIIVIGITMISWIILTSWTDVNENEMIYMYLFFPLLLILVVLFYQLLISVDSTEIKIRFGIGLIRKSWQISTIDSVTIVRNSFFHGWGIHYTLNTNIYNVSGMKAIELKFKNSSRKVRIGTEEPEKLAEFINSKISKNRKQA